MLISDLQGVGKAFKVTGEAAETRYPAKTTFNHPAVREKHKAITGVWEFDDL